MTEKTAISYSEVQMAWWKDMSKVSSKLRRGEGHYFHFCPACQDLHPLPDSWTFVNKDLERPTFAPSFLHKWNDPEPKVCHYILTDGVLNFCGDSTHSMAGKSVPLPELPLEYQ